MIPSTSIHRIALTGILALAGCGPRKPVEPAATAASTIATRTTLTIRDTLVRSTFDAAGVAEPLQRALLSTRLMGSVTGVLVREGDRVTRGQIVARIDARDIEARRAQVEANIGAADATYRDAETQAARFRALYADSAATRYQLDQVEMALSHAEAGLSAARGARAEVDAMGAYAVLEAPFAGVVTRRFVDPGSFVAPGAPLLELQDPSVLRIRVTAPPLVADALRRGAALEVTIENRPARGTVEGAVPGPAAVYSINVLVDNARREFLPGSSATVRIPTGQRSAMVIPTAALIREGDLTGVRVRTPRGVERHWIKIRDLAPGATEVLAGLRDGDVILLGGN